MGRKGTSSTGKKRKRPTLESFFGGKEEIDEEEQPRKRARTKEEQKGPTLEEIASNPELLKKVPDMFLSKEQRQRQRALIFKDSLKEEQRSKQELCKKLVTGKDQIHAFFSLSAKRPSASDPPSSDLHHQGLIHAFPRWDWGIPFHVSPLPITPSPATSGSCIAVPLLSDEDLLDIQDQAWTTAVTPSPSSIFSHSALPESRPFTPPAEPVLEPVPTLEEGFETRYLAEPGVKEALRLMTQRYRVEKAPDLLAALVRHKVCGPCQSESEGREAEDGGEADGRGCSVLWTELYAPPSPDLVCGNKQVLNFLLSWLSRFDDTRALKASKTRRHKPRAKSAPVIDAFLQRRSTRSQPKAQASTPAKSSPLMDLFGEEMDDLEAEYKKESKTKEDGEYDVFADFDCGADSDLEDPFVSEMGNVVVLYGEGGRGKTHAVYCCARKLGFQVIEINPSVNRSSNALLKTFEEATQSHLMAGGPAATKAVASVILVEEADLVFEADKAFNVGLGKLIATSKRPVILTCNDVKQVKAHEEMSKHLVSVEDSHHEVLCYVMAVLVCEGVFSTAPDFVAQIEYLVVALLRYDLRHILLHLQLWLQHSHTVPYAWPGCPLSSLTRPQKTLWQDVLGVRPSAACLSSPAPPHDRVAVDALIHAERVLGMEMMFWNSYLPCTPYTAVPPSPASLQPLVECLALYASVADWYSLWFSRPLPQDSLFVPLPQAEEAVCAGLLQAFAALHRRQQHLAHVFYMDRSVPFPDSPWRTELHPQIGLANKRTMHRRRREFGSLQSVVLQSLPPHGKLSRQSLWLEYIPVVVGMERAERRRKEENNKRRFFHHLSSSLSADDLESLAKVSSQAISVEM